MRKVRLQTHYKLLKENWKYHKEMMEHYQKQMEELENEKPLHLRRMV